MLCNTSAQCFAFGGPVLPSEDQCVASIRAGFDYAMQIFPAYTPVDWQCISWDEEA
jgi:hypothetical protein